MSVIFDDVPRTLEGGAAYRVSQFDYLNCSSRVEAERVRQLMDSIYARYPRDRQEDLRQRLRSIDDTTHLSASFELVLYEVLVLSGHRVLEVEPSLSQSNRRPDFLIESPSRTRFYLEATLATGRSTADAGAQARLAEVLRAIDAIVSPNFFLNLYISGTPDSPVRIRRLSSEINQWLSGLDHAQVSELWSRRDGDVPTFVRSLNGLTIHIRPHPRQNTRGNSEARAIGARSLAPLVVKPQLAISNSVSRKATRYGALDLPFVVAVNALSDYADEESAFDALFGNPAFQITTTRYGHTEREIRQPDGAWHGPSGPINTRVTAVLSTEQLTMWSLATRKLRTFLNPWAQSSLPAISWPGDRVKIAGDRILREDGTTLRSQLSLSETWPE
jgi:hypothetical protein